MTIATIAAALTIGVLFGFLMYHHRARASLAVDALAGRIKLESGHPLCTRAHLKGDEEAISKSKLRELLDANTQLIVARGFIAGAGGNKATAAFAESVNQTFDKDAPAPKISESTRTLTRTPD